jgi:hypothetical protein
MQLIKPTLLDTAIKTLLDELPDGTIYVGKADVGANESDPIWLIFRISVTGTVTKVEYAD